MTLAFNTDLLGIWTLDGGAKIIDTLVPFFGALSSVLTSVGSGTMVFLTLTILTHFTSFTGDAVTWVFHTLAFFTVFTSFTRYAATRGDTLAC